MVSYVRYAREGGGRCTCCYLIKDKASPFKTNNAPPNKPLVRKTQGVGYITNNLKLHLNKRLSSYMKGIDKCKY